MSLALPRFDKGDVLDLDGTLLRLDRQWDDGTLALTRVRSDRPFILETGEQPTVEWLMTEWATGHLHKKSNKIGPVHGRWETLEQEHVADARRAEARRVQFILMQLDAWGCGNSRPAVERHLQRLFTPDVIEKYGRPPSASTVCKWLATRGTIGNRTLDNCRPKQGQGHRQRRLNEEVARLRTDAALYWWSAEEVSLEDAHAQHVAWVENLNADRSAHGLEPVRACGIEWLRVRICETQNYDTYATKFGRPKANAFYATHGKGVKASRFLEIGIIDHHIFDSYVALEELGDELLPVGRPTVTATYDVKTECIVSAVVSFVPPSLFNMLEAIKQANRRRWGSPVSDQSRERPRFWRRFMDALTPFCRITLGSLRVAPAKTLCRTWDATSIGHAQACRKTRRSSNAGGERSPLISHRNCREQFSTRS